LYASLAAARRLLNGCARRSHGHGRCAPPGRDRNGTDAVARFRIARRGRFDMPGRYRPNVTVKVQAPVTGAVVMVLLLFSVAPHPETPIVLYFGSGFALKVTTAP